MEEEEGMRLSKRFGDKKGEGGGEVDFKTKAGTAWSHNFLNQKPWHPLSYPNQRRKWIAEQTHAQKSRRAEEVSREYAQEQEFFRQTALVSKKEKEKLEIMKAVSFMYVRPPGYNPESAKAAEVADEQKNEGQDESNPSVVGASSSKELEFMPIGDEKKKRRPKDVFGRTLPTEEQFEVLKNAPKMETGVAGRPKPFGIEIRNVKCLRCGNFGHQSGDRECPLKDVIMPNEENRLKRDDPLTAILAQTESSEPLKWELKQKPGLSPPRGGFDLDDPNQQIVAEDIYDEYGGFLTGDVSDLLANLSSSKPKKKSSSKSRQKRRLPPITAELSDREENGSSSEDDRSRRLKKRHRRKTRKHSEPSSSKSEYRRHRKKSSRHKRSQSSSSDKDSDSDEEHRRKHHSHRRHKRSQSSSSDDSDYDEQHRRTDRSHHRHKRSRSSSPDDSDYDEQHRRTDSSHHRHKRSRSSSPDDSDYDEQHRRTDRSHRRHKRSQSSSPDDSDYDEQHRRTDRSHHRHKRSRSSSPDDSDYDEQHKRTDCSHRRRKRSHSSSPDDSDYDEQHRCTDRSHRRQKRSPSRSSDDSYYDEQHRRTDRSHRRHVQSRASSSDDSDSNRQYRGKHHRRHRRRHRHYRSKPSSE